MERIYGTLFSGGVLGRECTANNFVTHTVPRTANQEFADCFEYRMTNRKLAKVQPNAAVRTRELLGKRFY